MYDLSARESTTEIHGIERMKGALLPIGGSQSSAEPHEIASGRISIVSEDGGAGRTSFGEGIRVLFPQKALKCMTRAFTLLARMCFASRDCHVWCGAVKREAAIALHRGKGS